MASAVLSNISIGFSIATEAVKFGIAVVNFIKSIRKKDRKDKREVKEMQVQIANTIEVKGSNNTDDEDFLSLARINRKAFNSNGIGILYLKMSGNDKYFEIATKSNRNYIEKLDYLSSNNSMVCNDAVRRFNELTRKDDKCVNAIVATNSIESSFFDNDLLNVQVIDYSIAAIIGYNYYFQINQSTMTMDDIPDGIYTVILSLENTFDMRMVKVENKKIYVFEKYSNSDYSQFNRMKYLKSKLGLNLSDKKFYKRFIDLDNTIDILYSFFDADENEVTITKSRLMNILKCYYDKILNIHNKWINIHNITTINNIIYLNNKLVDIPELYIKDHYKSTNFIRSRHFEWITIGAAVLTNADMLKGYTLYRF